MLNIRDKVKYSAKFLRSISAFTGSLPFARGEILVINDSIATIDWKDPEIPEKVNINNLVPEDLIELN